MVRHLALRIVQALGVLWAAYTVAFLVLYALPGDPAALVAAGGDPSASTATPEQIAELRARYGWDQPVPVQYVQHLAALARGDLGSSPRTGSVAASIGQAIWPTAQIALLATGLSLLGGGALALAATRFRVGPVRQLLLALPPLGVSVPSFWLALMLLQVFSFGLGWFPAFGNDGAASLVLPAITLATLGSATVAQVYTRSLDAEAAQPYAETALTKGAGPARVLWHIGRNAALPALAVAGVLAGQFLGGAVVTETVFSRTGLGQLTAMAVATQDIPLTLGIVVLGAATVVVVTLLVDLVQPLLDPRLSLAPVPGGRS
ncbi:peptide/nickel transport system permease protein [Naumannella cuiyingiana]|uniref:Peptide/nickel transport system permease protein n=1 Tax=Naumannella cuiyingiana TaxID=1347891 RepID=A0A7Z0IM29_9ACTN|nr:ABC transporter permease [Naumannella cuiyingiana]NYI72142.1 peptide/nickel transport system permease protein [Naumannella cuiyingiana]